MGSCCSTARKENNNDASRLTSDMLSPVEKEPFQHPSLVVSDDPEEYPSNVQGRSSKKGPLTLEDINARITASESTETVSLGNGITLDFAYVSQRGYYPDALTKPNQDSFLCIPSLTNNSKNDISVFSVFDGHGSYGDICAKFAADKLAKNILDGINDDNSEDNTNVQRIISDAHELTNDQLHSAPVDDSMSGTTAVSIFFCKNSKTYYVSNVGDSRAILGYRNKQQQQHSTDETNEEEEDDHQSSLMLVKPLSIDQTPFRLDERNRVKKTGARVMTVDQLEGVEPMHEDWGGLTLGDELDESGDPPRIWHPFGDYPGTAFTRSIGDSVSEELGVVATPEIIEKTLDLTRDEYIILASDGVFEFLTSQTVMDMTCQCTDPLEACRVVVEEAYNRWLQYEVRTDDITMICIKISVDESASSINDIVLEESSSASLLSNRTSVIGSLLAMEGVIQRPVRGALAPKGESLLRHRNTILGLDGVRLSMGAVASSTSSSSDEYNINDHRIKKTQEQEQSIRNIVSKNFLFSNLDPSQMQDIIDVMEFMKVGCNEFVIKEGDTKADLFYVVSTGEFDVRVLGKKQKESNTDNPEDYGSVIRTYSARLNFHPTFGELALMYAKPRAATVVCNSKEGGTLWTLSRNAFRRILMRRPTRDIVSLLKTVSVLSPLSPPQLQVLADELQEVTFDAGTDIVKEGDVGNVFYIITSGTAVVSTAKDGVVGHLKERQYFGERALLLHEPRAATVTSGASTITSCLSIKRSAFESSIGNLSKIIEHDIQLKELKNRIQRTENSFYPIKKDNSGTVIELSDIKSIIKVKNENENDPTDITRLVIIGKDLVMRTLRTVPKKNVMEQKNQFQVLGEYELNLGTVVLEDSDIPCITHVCHTSSDIHYLYDTKSSSSASSSPIVGTVDTFLPMLKFDKALIQYIVASVITTLEYFHSKGIVLRNISPTNIAVTSSGKIVSNYNMRLAKYVGSINTTGRTFTLCGDSEYVSPEMINSGHGLMTDIWSLGVLTYEMLFGHTPWTSLSTGEEENDEMKIFSKISDFKELEFPCTNDDVLEIQEFIKAVLKVDPADRLGFTEHITDDGGITAGSSSTRTMSTTFDTKKFQYESLRTHSMFKDFDWENLAASPLRQMASSRLEEILMSSKENEDSGYFESLDIGDGDYNTIDNGSDTEWLKAF